MNAYAVVYRNEGRVDRFRELAERAIPFLMDEANKYDDDGSNEPLELVREIEQSLASNPPGESALQSANSALDGGAEATYTLHTLCKTPECAVESVSPLEGAEVFGMATIAVEAEPVSGMRFRLDWAKRQAGMDDFHANCDMCNGRGEIGGHVGQTAESFDYVTEPCPDCTTTLREAAAAGIEGERE